MKSNEEIDVVEDSPGELGTEVPASVDEFIRELEAREKDLHISAEMVIEVSESEVDDKNIPDFVARDLSKAPTSIKVKVPATAIGEARLKGEVAELENTISKFKAERAEILERSRRQMDDFESYRNRTERERHESFSHQMVNLAVQMLPVLDNLNRALDFGAEMSDEKRAEIEQFYDGIVLVNQQVNDVLAGMGVQPIPAIGETFDPHLHEAVATEPSADHEPNTVLEEMLRGYRIGNHVIRHSIVKVSSAAGNGNTFEKAGDDEFTDGEELR
jgi:molecular chaperone GrpE